VLFGRPSSIQANTRLCHNTRRTYARVSLYGMFSVQMSLSIGRAGNQRSAALSPAL